jgi:hypothetical protein
MVKNLGSGRGRTSFYPDWVVERCVRIRQLVKARKSLHDIARILPNQEAEERWAKGHYDFSKANEQLDYSAAVRNLAELLSERISLFFDKVPADLRAICSQLDAVVFDKSKVQKVFGFLLKGCDVLLTYDGTQFDFVPDFVFLATLKRSNSGVLVWPVAQETFTTLSAIMPGLPEEPTLAPVARVAGKKRGRTVEYEVHVLEGGDFQLAKARRGK